MKRIHQYGDWLAARPLILILAMAAIGLAVMTLLFGLGNLIFLGRFYA